MLGNLRGGCNFRPLKSYWSDVPAKSRRGVETMCELRVYIGDIGADSVPQVTHVFVA